MTSVEFWISDRNRSSFWLTRDSAISFFSMTAPAMRMTKNRTNAAMNAKALACEVDSIDGAHPAQMAAWPAAIPSRLHRAVARQSRDPSREIFSSATKAKASTKTGPQPLR